MKLLKRIISFVLAAQFILLLPAKAKAQERHLYFKGDFTSLNLFTEVATMGITALINRSTGEFTYDNIWNFAITGGDLGGNSINFNLPSYTGVSLRSLFGNFGTGVKLGYKTDNIGFFNFAAFGSLHYRLNNFASSLPNSPDYDNNAIHRIQVGLGGNVTFGRIDQSIRVMVEVGARYNIPVYYSGVYGDGVGCLNSGITPTLAITVGGPKLMKKMGLNVGLHFEFMSYDWFKESQYFTKPYSISTWNMGVNLTMCPWK